MKRPSWIVALVEHESVAYSRVRSAKDKQTLDTLRSLGLVAVKTSGTRRTIAIANNAQFVTWLNTEYPQHDSNIADSALRAGNVRVSRDSKSGHSRHAVQPLVLRWFDQNAENEFARLTDQFGVASILTNRLQCIDFPARWYLLTIENWESFYTLSYSCPEVPVLSVYLGGNASAVVLKALAALEPAPSAVLHFGDYDWAGLEIFSRLVTVLPQARLYVAPQLELLFQHYGNRALVTEQPFRGEHLEHPQCRVIVEHISRFNAGVEQEIVPPPAFTDFGIN